MDLATMNSTEVNSKQCSSFDDKIKIHVVYGALLIFVFAFSVYKAPKDKVTTSLVATCNVVSIFIIIFVVCNVILYLCPILVQLTDASQWSCENLMSTLRSYFIFNISWMVIVGCAALLLLVQIVTLRSCPLYYMWNCGPYTCILSMVFSYLLLKWATFEWKPSRSVVFNLDDLKGLDYGTGMAYSYYYGYLRVILPSTGTATKGIVEKIENFEDKHSVTFPVHKLFILIPSSGYIPPDLKEASNQWMEKTQLLEEEVRNRAGNIGRKYSNIVYKIYPGGRKAGINPIYAVVEGASALLTFYEVLQHNHAETAIYRQFRSKIVFNFHKSLYNSLESELDTKDLCELIYYNDYEPDGTRVNIAKLILDRISKITSSM